MTLRGLLGLVAVTAVALAGCTGNSIAFDDPAAVSTAVRERATALGSTQLVELVIAGSGESGLVSVVRPDGSVAVSGVDGSPATGLTTTSVPGIPVATAPIGALVEARNASAGACDGADPTATLVSTQAGKSLITVACEGPPRRVLAQQLDGKPVARVGDLDSSAALTTVLGEAPLLVGDQVVELRITQKSALDGDPSLVVKAPAAKAGLTACVNSFSRSADAVTNELLCQPPSGSQPTEAFAVSSVSGAVMAGAVQKAYTLLGITEPGQVSTIVVDAESKVVRVTVTRADEAGIVSVDLKGNKLG